MPTLERDNPSFGEWLRRMRQEAGMSGMRLAAKVGLDQSYLNKVERGANPPPSAKNIVELAIALDVDADYLLALDGKIHPEFTDIILRHIDTIPSILRMLDNLSDDELSSLMNYMRTTYER